MEDSDEVLRTKLKQQLEQSGISSIVRTMVHRICSDREDLQEINLDEVVHEVYKKGGMEDFFESLDPRSSRHSRDRKGRSETLFESQDVEEIFAKHPSLSAQNMEDSDSDIIEEQLRKSGKYYLKMQVLGGKAFLDHLVRENDHTNATISTHLKSRGDLYGQEGADSQPKLILHVFYKSQRFSSKSVISCCDPEFKETFLIEIGRFGALDGSLTAKEMLSINEPLRIVVVREDVNLDASGAVPVAYCQHDWRTILIKENGFKNFSLELMGIGPEHNVCVGILRVRFTLIPLPHERISENSYLDKANEDGATQEDFERIIITMAKRWWKEYIEIRPDHQFRLVRLFAYDENMVARPVTTFIKPIQFNDLLVTPFQAAWFVALLRTTKSNHVKASDNMQGSSVDESKYGYKCKTLPGIQNGTGGCVLSERWQNVEMTIVSKSGTVEDHAVLLASLFLRFGLDAFVALGTKKGKGSWAWTVTLSENQEATFWESTTGEYYEHYSFPNNTGSSDKLDSSVLTRIAKNNIYGFSTISCLFNRKSLYANVQPTISTDFVDWNLENPSKWKVLSYSKECQGVSQYPIPLHGSIVNWEFTTKRLEFQLKNLLITVRKEKGKGTKLNEELSQYMGQHLYREEMQLSTGGSNFTDYFRTVALKTLPPGHEFRAHTFHSRFTEAHILFSKALREPLASEIIFPLGDSVRHALKVKTFPYPEDVTSIRFMIACTYIPV